MTTEQRLALAKNISLAAKSNIGYDQLQRFSYLDLKNNRIIPGTETDCSALTAGLIRLSGYPIDLSAPIWTGTIRERLEQIKWKVIPVFGLPITRIQALTVRGGGSVLVNERNHVIIETAEKGRWLSANIDERGRIAGGQAGNQTGNEVSIRNLWNYSHGGWHYLILPPEGDVDTSSSSAPVTATDKAKLLPTQTISMSTGAIKHLQRALKVEDDGIIGPMTIGAWQVRLGTIADRVVNKPSILVTAIQKYVNNIRDHIIGQGKHVSPSWMTLEVDGLWGPMTRAAVEEYLLRWNGGFTR